MPASVDSVFNDAGLTRQGAVRWGERIPEAGPGVYVVALTKDPNVVDSTVPDVPIATDAVGQLLDIRPELTIDGQRPPTEVLNARLAAFWLPDEVVVYIGLAGTSLQTRVGQYYATRLGARSPHAGGWFLKTLAVLDDLWVHYASCPEPAVAENQMLAAFSAGVSMESAAQLHDPDRPIPFANLEWPKRRYKRHGIRGANAPRSPSSPPRSGQVHRRAAAPVQAAKRGAPATGGWVSQRLSERDVASGVVRFPRASKAVFPAQRSDVSIVLRGERLDGRWDPRDGPDRERSGVLRLGPRLRERVRPGEVLEVTSGVPVRLD